MRRIGIEVEFGGNTELALAALRRAGLTSATSLHGYIGNHATEWVIKLDGSVGGGGELVSPPLNFDDPIARAQVSDAIAALRSAGCTTHPSAGIHIHVESSDLDGEQIAMLARCFTKFEDLIYRIACSGWQSMRSGARSYCRPLETVKVNALAKAKNDNQVKAAYFGYAFDGRPSHSDNNRFYGLNLQSHYYRGTVEFRVFNSSLNAERIQAYLAMCVTLVEDARRRNRRSITKAYRLGGMAAGTTNPANAYHRFQQVLRYEAGMSLEDMKRLNKCWKDSRPSVNFSY